MAYQKDNIDWKKTPPPVEVKLSSGKFYQVKRSEGHKDNGDVLNTITIAMPFDKGSLKLPGDISTEDLKALFKAVETVRAPSK